MQNGSNSADPPTRYDNKKGGSLNFLPNNEDYEQFLVYENLELSDIKLGGWRLPSRNRMHEAQQVTKHKGEYGSLLLLFTRADWSLNPAEGFIA